jgi:DNA invertase Pin-like site-specific DNA recombinase
VTLDLVSANRHPDSRQRLARDREIVTLRNRGLTLREIAERFALSHQRIAQILNRAGAGPVAVPSVNEHAPPTRRPAEADRRSRHPSLAPDTEQSRAAVAARRRHVRKLLAEGVRPSEIATRLDCRLTTIYRDLAWIRAADPQPRRRQ